MIILQVIGLSNTLIRKSSSIDLVCTVDHKQLECVKFLLEQGTDPNSGTRYDFSINISPMIN